MAIYHNHAKVLTKSSGRSPIAMSAYNNGMRMVNVYDGRVHDYSKKTEVVHREVMLCENAPDAYKDPEQLWNEVVKHEGQTGQRARTFEFSLPRELNSQEHINLVREYVQDNFVSKGMCADFAIHDKNDGNPHAHIGLTIRPINKDGEWETKTTTFYVCKNRQGEERTLTSSEWQGAKDEWEKKFPYYEGGIKNKKHLLYLTKSEASDPRYKGYHRVKGEKKPEQYSEYTNPKVIEWSSKEYLDGCRADLAVKINRELEKKGLSQRVDHRSYSKQNIIQLPTRHMGVAASAVERKGFQTERGAMNGHIIIMNRDIAALDRERKAVIVHIDELRKRQEGFVARVHPASEDRRPGDNDSGNVTSIDEIRRQALEKYEAKQNTTFATYDQKVEWDARKSKLAATKELAAALVTIRREAITEYSDFADKIKDLALQRNTKKGESKKLDSMIAEHKETLKHLATYNKYLHIFKKSDSKWRLTKKSFEAKHKSELAAFRHAAAKLEALGVDAGCDVQKIIAAVNEHGGDASRLDIDVAAIAKRLRSLYEARNIVDKVYERTQRKDPAREPEQNPEL